MVFYYRVFGLFAVSALLLNLVLLVAILSLLQATLTMPGIAGVVLHMGIAVDANVLIYERIREELRNGAKPHSAIEAGRSEARRVGKECVSKCRSRWSPEHTKKNRKYTYRKNHTH